MAQAAVESLYREYAKNGGVVRFPGERKTGSRSGTSDIK